MKSLTLAAALAAPLLCLAAGEPSPPKAVDWAGQVVRASGAGAPDLKAQNASQARLGAEKAALADGAAKLLVELNSLSIDGTKTLGELLEKPEAKARAEALARDATVASKRYFSDGGVVLELELPLARLTELFDPDATPAPLPGKSEGPQSSTGLIIDARGLGLAPALTLRLVDPAGKLLYGVDSLKGDGRKLAAAAAWVQKLEEAKGLRKAGERPLLFKPTGRTGVELALSAEDAQKLAGVNTGFLGDGKVVVVLGSPKDGQGGK